MNTRPPIIVIGAHRSGTSILNRVVGELGVFTGIARDPNDEAWFFLRLNEWLLSQAGGRWDHPEPLADLLAHDELRGLCVDYLRSTIDSPRSLRFLGISRYLRHRGISRIDTPWGFKDPRTTFTLPLWLELFPTAKVLHIHRHGVDVAASLHARQQSQLETSRNLFERNRTLLRWFSKRAGFTDSPRCSSLMGAFDVWEAYVLESRRQIQALGDRGFEVPFEQLATEPADLVRRIASFCDLSPTQTQVECATAMLNRSRANAHRDDPELMAFAEHVATRELAARTSTTREPVTT